MGTCAEVLGQDHAWVFKEQQRGWSEVSGERTVGDEAEGLTEARPGRVYQSAVRIWKAIGWRSEMMWFSF